MVGDEDYTGLRRDYLRPLTGSGEYVIIQPIEEAREERRWYIAQFRGIVLKI